MTTIVATVGPACRSEQCVAAMVAAGVDVFRLNFSHGTHEQHEENLGAIRRAAARAGRAVAVVQDLQGPRIRTGRLKEPGGVLLVEGREISIRTGDSEGDDEVIYCNYERLPEDVGPGDRILLSDGLIELRVASVSGDCVRCVVLSGGTLRQRVGINLPGVDLSISLPTEKDLADLQFGLKHSVDYIALSFVRSPDDIRRLKQSIAESRPDGGGIPVIAKIEKPVAVGRLTEILDECEAVMVARGDLGIEMPPEMVPVEQKRIIRAANERAMPVITATQMLDSMVANPRPTRAEASDVANAILDGTDAVMLSAETAVGKYPLEAVRMMDRIDRQTESSASAELSLSAERTSGTAGAREHALAGAACRVASQLGASGIAAFTVSGRTARYISQRRPQIPIFALTPNRTTLNRMALLWGVCPVELAVFGNTDEMIEQGEQRLLDLGLAEVGDTMVCVAGASTGTPGGTDMLKIHYFGAKSP